MSLLMLEELVDANGVDIEQEDIRSVQDLISGKPSRSYARSWAVVVEAMVMVDGGRCRDMP